MFELIVATGDALVDLTAVAREEIVGRRQDALILANGDFSAVDSHGVCLIEIYESQKCSYGSG
jgi:hypothetical protein